MTIGILKSLSASISRFTASSRGFQVALIAIIVWAVSGFAFHFSNAWLLIINTGTSIITFLMVFIIQEAQNRHTLALQLKLNELIAATRGASNKVLNIEDLTGEELRELKEIYARISELSRQQGKSTASFTMDEADKFPEA